MRLLFSDTEDAELTITYKNAPSPYLDKLRSSKRQLEEGKDLTTFTIEELESYTDKMSGK